MRLGCDVDGVLANFGSAFRRVLRETSGRALIPEGEEPPVWDWPEHYGYTAKEIRAAWAAVSHDPGFWQYLDALPGAQEFLAWLWRSVSTFNWTDGFGGFETNVEVYFITTRLHGRAVKRQTELWLQRNGFLGESRTVCIARGEKGHLAAGLGLTHMIDDRPENLASVVMYAPTCRTYLRRVPYNKSFVPLLTSDGIVVVDSLEQFREHLEAALR
jgi:hypothetical protein